jgi:hypothetical protein
MTDVVLFIIAIMAMVGYLAFWLILGMYKTGIEKYDR